MKILMTLDEARQSLNISASTLRRLIAKNAISFYRVGLRIMFSDEHINDFLKSAENRRYLNSVEKSCRKWTVEPDACQEAS
jgi:excisionase family DNA binding protein